MPKRHLAVVFLVLAVASGCTKTFRIQPVTLPAQPLVPAADTASTYVVRDVRRPADSRFNVGTLQVVLRGMSNEIAYLHENLARVLGAQGIRVTSGSGEAADLVLEVRKFRIRNLRTSGYSPYHSFATFSGDLHVGGETHRITSYVKGSKTPIWAFSEVERPCYQVPVESLVREVAAKINRIAFHRQLPTEAVQRIAAQAGGGRSDSASEAYLEVLELGYSNNPAAVEPLVRLTERKEVLLRASAVSALGTLGARDQLPLLQTIYERDEDVAREMALKSIGDLGTPESAQFLQAVRRSSKGRDERIREVLELYE